MLEVLAFGAAHEKNFRSVCANQKNNGGFYYEN